VPPPPEIEAYDVLALFTGVEDDAHPPPSSQVRISPELVVSRLEPRFLRRLAVACKPTGFPPAGERIELGWWPYAFVRTDPPPSVERDSGLRTWWDEDQVIRTAVALSRLVWANGVSPEYAGRCERRGAELVRIVPAEGAPSAYVADPSRRPWLTEAELIQLRTLMEHYRASDSTLPRPGRVRNALWFAEYAAETYFAELRWAHVVTALEALLNTSDDKATKQFKVRFTALANELGFGWVTGSRADRIYDARSRVVHGETELFGTALGKDDATASLARVEEVLRAALRRAIEDPEFQRTFDDAASIEARFGRVS
jgi:hypothetical protein